MKAWYQQSWKEILEYLHVSEDGRTPEEAERLLEEKGENVLQESRKKTVLQVFLSQFCDLLVLILIAAALISALTKDVESTVVILAVLVLNAVLGTVQHQRAEKSLDSLKALSSPSVKVVRGGQKIEIPSRKVVPGDIVLLEAGDMIVAKAETVKTEELETRYERYKGILKDLTIMSDVFMRNVFKKRECTEYVLQVIMNKKDLKVIDQVLQKDYKNLQGRSAILDCVTRDSEGKQMDVEIQQDNEGASPKRARYHSGLMDMNTLNPGQDFDDLPESYVIFITRDDALGYGLPIYHIDRKIEEVSENFKDEAHIIYVNSKKQEDTELGRLMHDLHCKNAEDMHSKILADRVYELKETQKGVEFMCREMEQIYSEGIESGELKKAKASALSMAADGMKVDKIAHYLNVSAQMVQKWIDESMSVAH